MPCLVYLLIFLAWIVLLISPGTLFQLTVVFFFVFSANLGWSAITRRSTGWGVGALLALLLLTLPAWVWGFYRLYELLPREPMP